jgi:sporulation protein YlmC with PRC-barrel domain
MPVSPQKHMKTFILIGIALATLGLAGAPVNAQTETSTTSTSSTSYVQTSKIVGMKVKDSRGEEVGVVKDVVLDRNTGCMAYTLLSTGGGGTQVTENSKIVPVPWSIYTTTSDPSVITVRIDRERIYGAPAFDYARMNEYSTSGWINNVYSYYGVQPGVGVNVNVGSERTNQYNRQTGVAAQVIPMLRRACLPVQMQRLR